MESPPTTRGIALLKFTKTKEKRALEITTTKVVFHWSKERTKLAHCEINGIFFKQKAVYAKARGGSRPSNKGRGGWAVFFKKIFGPSGLSLVQK